MKEAKKQTLKFALGGLWLGLTESQSFHFENETIYHPAFREYSFMKMGSEKTKLWAFREKDGGDDRWAVVLSIHGDTLHCMVEGWPAFFAMLKHIEFHAMVRNDHLAVLHSTEENTALRHKRLDAEEG
jgi:hypothetical protein